MEINGDWFVMNSLYGYGLKFLGVIEVVDNHIAQWLNLLSALPGPANRLLVLLSEANFLKVVPFVLVATWYWNREPRTANRQIIIHGFIGVMLAFMLGRVLQLTLPHRARPIHAPRLDLQLPAGMVPDIMGGWNSFPSDHAAIFAALVGLTFALSRTLGGLGLAYAIVVVLLPRAYLGYHFPSDILGGFAIGTAVSWLVQGRRFGSVVGLTLERVSQRHPAAFYVAAILFLTQLVQMFGDVRRYSSIAKGLIVGTL